MAYKITFIEIFAIILMISVYIVLIVKLDIKNNLETVLTKTRIYFSDVEIPQRNCSFIQPLKPTVVLRIDDVQAGAYTKISIRMIDDILGRNMKITLAVIPKSMAHDTIMKNYLQSVVGESVEIAQHGYTSAENEFGNLTEIEAGDLLKKGFNELYVNFDVLPLTFIPPNNVYSYGTINALQRYGFKIISAGDKKYTMTNKIFFIGFDTETYDYEKKEVIAVSKIINDCREAFARNNLCVVMIHPQDFLRERTRIIDEDKYTNFIELLDVLKTHNVEFKTFSGLLKCG